MTYQTLLFDIRDGIATVTVNRPDKLNALNDQVMAELGDAVERITATPVAPSSPARGQRRSSPAPTSQTCRVRDRSTEKRAPCAVRACCGGSRRAASPSSRR
jgi:hypothetical protein